MKKLKLKSPDDYPGTPKVLRSSSKKARQKNPDSKNSALDSSSSSTEVPQHPPSPRANYEDGEKTNFPSTSFCSTKELSPDPNIKRVEDLDVFRKTPLNLSITKSDSELPLKQVKVKLEKLSPTKKHWKHSYLESSQKEWQKPEAVNLEHNFNNETNCNKNDSNRSTVVIKKEYEPIPPTQSVPMKDSHSSHTLSNSDIYPENSSVLNPTVSKITDHPSTSVDLSKTTLQKNSSYLQNTNTLHTSWANNGKLQETNANKSEPISIQTQDITGQRQSQVPLGNQMPAVSNNQNLPIQNYMHEDSCLNLLLSEDEQNLRHEMNYNYFAQSQPFGPKQDYLNFVPPKPAHDLHPWMTMGLPSPQQPNVSYYVYPRPQIAYGSAMAPYPQQPIPPTSAMCQNQNLPLYESGIIPGPMTQVSDSNLMPSHLMKSQSQGGYFVHSMQPSPSAPFSFLPNQNPSQMGPTLSNMTVKAPPKGTMIRRPTVRLPDSFISTAETSVYTKSPSSECHDFNSGNNEEYSQETQLLDKTTKLVDLNRTDELFGVFHDYQIPKSISGATKGQFILRKYIDFLILENEGITEMSQAYTPPTPLYSFEEDQYILEASSDDALFPTSKFERFIQIHFPSIDLHSIDFSDCKGSIYTPRKLETNMDKIRDIFFYFQTVRGTTGSITDSAISDNNGLAI